MKYGSALQRRNINEQSHRVHIDDLDDEEDDIDCTSIKWHHQKRWYVIIVGLIFLNVILGYAHIQRRTARSRPESLDIVKILSDETVSDHIASHPNGTLVNFYFPSCKPCAKLAPEFEEAARQLQRTSTVSLVAVDADHAPLILQRYSLKIFPLMLWFRRGRLVRHAEPSVRDYASIIEFVEESLQPAIIEFATHDELNEALPELRSIMARGKSTPVVVGFGRNSDVYEVLQEMGEKFRGVTAFLFVKEAQDSDPFLKVYFQHSEADKEYDTSSRIEDVQTWLEPLMSDGIPSSTYRIT